MRHYLGFKKPPLRRFEACSRKPASRGLPSSSIELMSPPCDATAPLAQNQGLPCSSTKIRTSWESNWKIDGAGAPWADADMALLLLERLANPLVRRGGQALTTARRRRAYSSCESCISLTPAH